MLLSGSHYQNLEKCRPALAGPVLLCEIALCGAVDERSEHPADRRTRDQDADGLDPLQSGAVEPQDLDRNAVHLRTRVVDRHDIDDERAQLQEPFPE